VPPSGEPICEKPDEAHSLLTVGPTTNHAPASAASQAPNAAKARLALLSKIRPPAAVAAPGTTSNHSRAGVYTHTVPGV
jgi:hypothetical protein